MNRRPLDGPVIADLAAQENYTPTLAAHDAAWAATALAGRARDAAELADWLKACGLLDADTSHLARAVSA